MLVWQCEESRMSSPRSSWRPRASASSSALLRCGCYSRRARAAAGRRSAVDLTSRICSAEWRAADAAESSARGSSMRLGWQMGSRAAACWLSGELGWGIWRRGGGGAPRTRSAAHPLHMPQAGVQPGLGGTTEDGGWVAGMAANITFTVPHAAPDQIAELAGAWCRCAVLCVLW